MARKRRTVEAPQTSPAVAEAAEVEVVEAPVVAAETPPAPTKPVAWLVKKDARVSLYGHLTYLHAGTVVALSEYGPQGIERLREQNVVLEPMV